MKQDTDPKTAWTTKQMGWLCSATESDGVHVSVNCPGPV